MNIDYSLYLILIVMGFVLSLIGLLNNIPELIGSGFGMVFGTLIINYLEKFW